MVSADDTMSADSAYRLACEGTGLLWQGDFQNARQLLQALVRRLEPKAKKSKKPAPPVSPAQAFNLHRQALGQRARVLGQLLIPMDADYSIPLRRAPDLRQACTEAWGPTDGQACMVSLRELLGLVGAHEWRKKGLEIAALGVPPLNRIHPHYGVFSPVRGEYLDLVAQAPLPPACLDKSGMAFDIGVGTGVLSAILARRGVQGIIATDQDPRALACAKDNLSRLKLNPRVELLQADLFPAQQADLIVCNPPAKRKIVASSAVRTLVLPAPTVMSSCLTLSVSPTLNPSVLRAINRRENYSRPRSRCLILRATPGSFASSMESA